MKEENKKWAFTEILGIREDVESAIHELSKLKIIHGAPCSCEDKAEKRLVQFYECRSDVCTLSVEEQEKYNTIALNCNVYIEYSYMGKVVADFPLHTDYDFCLKYWEWWMR